MMGRKIIRSIAPVAAEGTRPQELELKVSWVSPGFKLETVALPEGPAFLENTMNVSEAAPYILSEVEKAAHEGCSGIVIDCFADPLLEECRRISPIPVVGAGLSALCVGRSLGEKLAVIIPTESMQQFTQSAVSRHGIPIARWEYVLSGEEPEAALRSDKSRTAKALTDAYRRCCSSRDIDVVVLGCTCLELFWLKGLHKAIDARLPVVFPFRAAVRILEAVIGNTRMQEEDA